MRLLLGDCIDKLKELDDNSIDSIVTDPPELEEFISTYIDHNKIFERELKGKLQDFFDSIGWGDVISEQRTAEKFFTF